MAGERVGQRIERTVGGGERQQPARQARLDERQQPGTGHRRLAGAGGTDQRQEPHRGRGQGLEGRPQILLQQLLAPEKALGVLFLATNLSRDNL
jgi:hypothetical protein